MKIPAAIHILGVNLTAACTRAATIRRLMIPRRSRRNAVNIRPCDPQSRMDTHQQENDNAITARR